MRRTAVVALMAAGLLGAQVVKYKDIKYPPLNPIRVPESTRYVMSNGITVFLVEDHELPTIRASALIRTGSRHEPLEKAGLATITLETMRSGGTASRPGDELDKELDRLGASVEISADASTGAANMFVLKQDVDRGLAILADVLQGPAFPQDKIDLAKIKLRDGISRRNDSPMGIHGRELRRLLCGKESPYARQAEYATLDAIEREDLAAFHKEYFQPENVIFGAWGDFQAADMKARLEKAFGGWARGGRPKPAIPPVKPEASSLGLHLIKKDDVNQSSVGISLLLGKRNDPDYYALVVMTRVLGGGNASRMYSRIRTHEGLAYAVGGYYNAGYDHPGAWTAFGGTKSQSTLEILKFMQREIKLIREAEVTDEELLVAKDGILKGEAFEFDSTGKIVGRMLTYEYYGYPQDYLQKYQENIRKVTKADVLRVARQYLQPERFSILVLGKPADFEQPLSALGGVKDVDITIPAPKPAKAAAAATPNTVNRKP